MYIYIYICNQKRKKHVAYAINGKSVYEMFSVGTIRFVKTCTSNCIKSNETNEIISTCMEKNAQSNPTTSHPLQYL